jgi:Holliday junction resolvase-like predicted endonuclease
MPIAGLEHALDRRKQGRILRTARWYLARHPIHARLQPRFDVIFIHDDVVHLKNAFGENGAW